MALSESIYINIHGHRMANNIQEWVLRNMFAQDYPPEDIEFGNYSVGFHPYHVGQVDEEDALNKVRLATENLNVCAIGEIGLDKAIEAPLNHQMRIFETQVEIAEFAELPVILHVVRAFNEVLAFMKTNKPVVPMIIHGFNGNARMAEDLIKEGCYISFGEAIAGNNQKVIDALKTVPVEKMFLETDEGELDIRELYQITSEVKKISNDLLRLQIFENTKTSFSRFPGQSV
jgi:TatD DNase family protein